MLAVKFLNSFFRWWVQHLSLLYSYQELSSWMSSFQHRKSIFQRMSTCYLNILMHTLSIPFADTYLYVFTFLWLCLLVILEEHQRWLTVWLDPTFHSMSPLVVAVSVYLIQLSHRKQIIIITWLEILHVFVKRLTNIFFQEKAPDATVVNPSICSCPSCGIIHLGHFLGRWKLWISKSEVSPNVEAWFVLRTMFCCFMISTVLQAYANPSNYVNLAVVLSTLLATWSFQMIYNLSRIPLSHTAVKPKFICLQLVLLVAGFQKAMISIFSATGVIPCEDPLNEHANGDSEYTQW